MNVRKRLALVVWLFLLFALAPLATAQPSFGTNDPFRAIPTFHSLSVYWNPSNKSTARFAHVEYKPQGAPDSAYKPGLDLWYDDRTPAPNGGTRGEYRGSLVHLEPNTAYDLRLRLTDGETGPVIEQRLVPAQTACPVTGQQIPASCTKTWTETENFSIAHEVVVPANTTRIVIVPVAGSALPAPSTNGSTFTVSAPTEAAGYTRISAPSTPPGRNHIVGGSEACIEIRHGTRKVILTGLVIRDCARYGVQFVPTPQSQNTSIEDIVIENNEFYGWGGFGNDNPGPFTGFPNGLPDQDGAIDCPFGADSVPKPRRIIMQGNIFRDPRHNSTRRRETPGHNHQEGAIAVRLGECGGNHVFRYNDVYSTPNAQTGQINHFMDGFGGGENDRQGTPGPDSDIYGNRISHVYDDAIQTEGAGRNVRVWGNYMDHVFVAIGNVPVRTGPLYVWRNISDHMALMHDGPNADPDTDQRHEFIKGGDNQRGETGRAYYFHNTVLQPPQPNPTSRTLGAGDGLNATQGPLYDFVSKNNIWHVVDTNRLSINADCNLGFCESNFDLYNGRIEGAGSSAESDGVTGTPVYQSAVASGASYTAYPNQSAEPGNFSLATNTPGYRQGVAIPNFNDQRPNTSVPPDIGAHQSGTNAMKFGRAAAGQSDPGGGGGELGPTAALDTSPSPADIAANESVTFNSSSTPGNSTFTSITLDFGDGSPVVDWLPDHPAPKSHTYTVPRATPYTATLTVTTADGRSDDAPVTVAVSCGANAPSAILEASSPTSGPKPLEVTFTVQSSAVSPATIQSYSIDYGDGTSGTDLVHTYTTAAQRTASLVVTDSNDCKSAPSELLITVTNAGGEETAVTLQQGLGGYTDATDTKIASAFPSSNFGASGSLDLRMETSVSVLTRFAIFASEGGPVPNNATITSATLSFYKHSGAEATMKVSRLLKNWTESGATWQATGAGANWTTVGARGAGSDYLATHDDQALIGSATGCAGQDGGSQCWINFNVTAGVQAFRNGTPNYGWKLAYVSGPLEPPKWIYSRDNAGWPTLRPKLAITYTVPTGNTVTLMHELNGYAGATDTKIASAFPSSNFGTQPNLDIRMDTSVSVLSRFAIFASEGGPVPDNATITLATLSFYKHSGAEATMKVSRLLKNWTESGATWQATGAGANWTMVGARGAGSDYLATPDAQASVGSGTGCSGQDGGPRCWINFNVTAGVQAFRDGTPNYGWKLGYVSGPLEPPKWIYAREIGSWPTLRPKLLIEYTQ